MKGKLVLILTGSAENVNIQMTPSHWCDSDTIIFNTCTKCT